MADERVSLSEREIEVLTRLASGASNQEIARDLVISVNTVKVHVRNVFDKLGVQSRTEATLYAIRHGLVTVDGESRPLSGVTGPIVDQVTEPAPRRPPAVAVSGWQRAYAGLVSLLALALLILPGIRLEPNASADANPISDRRGMGTPSTWVAASRWARNADLPTPRTRLALVAYAGQLYAIGGDRASGVTGLVEVYDRQSDSWTARAPKPRPVSNIGAAVLGERIYVPGGCTDQSNAIGQMEVYVPAEDRWSEAAPLPMPLCAYALAVADGRMYLFGGWDGRQFVDQVWMYDPRNDTWLARAPLPSPRGFAAAGVMRDLIYVVGGYTGTQELPDTLAYSVASDSWSGRSPMHTPRAGLGVAVINDRLYAIGGGWQSYLATNEQYDPATDGWSVFESPVLGQWRNLGVAALDAEIYAVGGWNGDYIGINQAYRALFRIMLPVVQ